MATNHYLEQLPTYSFGILLPCDIHVVISLSRALITRVDIPLTMNVKCSYLQLPPQFCQKYVPSNTLDKLNTTKRQNPQENSANGYDILDTSKPQVLSWTPTTEGTVSLKLYRAPGEGEQYTDGGDSSVGLLDQQDVIRTSLKSTLMNPVDAHLANVNSQHREYWQLHLDA